MTDAIQLITRKDAIAAGLPFYFTGLPCGRGHVTQKSVKGHRCRQCGNAWKKENSHKVRDQKRAWKAKNREKEAIRQRESNRRSYALNIERKRAIAKESKRRRVAERNADSALRRAHKLQATPLWADQLAIRRVYIAARSISNNTGVPHHVDHFIPLVGKNVCGLHVETNLRIIPGLENIAKGNKLPV
jgi:hypothetical protein